MAVSVSSRSWRAAVALLARAAASTVTRPSSSSWRWISVSATMTPASFAVVRPALVARVDSASLTSRPKPAMTAAACGDVGIFGDSLAGDAKAVLHHGKRLNDPLHLKRLCGTVHPHGAKMGDPAAKLLMRLGQRGVHPPAQLGGRRNAAPSARVDLAHNHLLQVTAGEEKRGVDERRFKAL